MHRLSRPGEVVILYYVSGHGFGHATRSRAVIDALLRTDNRVRVCVRTAAPAFLFQAPGLEDRLVCSHALFEPRVIESSDALRVDPCATLQQLVEFRAQAEDVVRTEVSFARQIGATLIVADIPFIAGAVAARTGVTAIAISNFTWEWIYSSISPGDQSLDLVRRDYRSFAAALHLPLHHEPGWDLFPQVQDIPLLTPRSQRPRELIRQELGLGKQTAVLIGGRAQLSDAALARLEKSCPELVFLRNNSLPSVHDVIRASDVVVSKIGYSIAAECIAERKRLLFPPREGFPEEQVLVQQVPRRTAALPIPVAEWRAGNWAPYLSWLLRMQIPQQSDPCDGADVAARLILNQPPYITSKTAR